MSGWAEELGGDEDNAGGERLSVQDIMNWG